MPAIQSASILEDNPVASDNRRDWTRFPPEASETVLVVAGAKLNALLLDESYGGVGLLVERSPAVRVGDQVIVDYYGAPVAGMVRRVVAADTGQTVVGVEFAANW